MTTDFKLRYREGMSSLLRDGDQTVAVIHDPRYEQLLLWSARLREQLGAAIFVLDNLPDVQIDTTGMHEVLMASGWEEK
jgi:hypothetical protein